jgi:hypothetical protein
VAGPRLGRGSGRGRPARPVFPERTPRSVPRRRGGTRDRGPRLLRLRRALEARRRRRRRRRHLRTPLRSRRVPGGAGPCSGAARGRRANLLRHPLPRAAG